MEDNEMGTVIMRSMMNVLGNVMFESVLDMVITLTVLAKIEQRDNRNRSRHKIKLRKLFYTKHTAL